MAKHIKKALLEETVKALTDEQRLIKIIKNDANLFEIRELATKQLTNTDLLKEIIFDTSDTSYTKGDLFDIREVAVTQIMDDETLFDIVKKYYDESVDTKYGINVVKRAIGRIKTEHMLLDIADSKYDEEITDAALDRINRVENQDKTKLTLTCDDDSKVKRMCALDQIDDDEVLLDIAMNAKYLDVREAALSKVKIEDERVIVLKELILKEKEYNESVDDYISLDEENEEIKQDIIDKASNLGVEYKRAGNTKKEKFYNAQCNLFNNDE